MTIIPSETTITNTLIIILVVILSIDPVWNIYMGDNKVVGDHSLNHSYVAKILPMNMNNSINAAPIKLELNTIETVTPTIVIVKNPNSCIHKLVTILNVSDSLKYKVKYRIENNVI